MQFLAYAHFFEHNRQTRPNICSQESQRLFKLVLNNMDWLIDLRIMQLVRVFSLVVYMDHLESHMFQDFVELNKVVLLVHFRVQVYFRGLHTKRMTVQLADFLGHQKHQESMLSFLFQKQLGEFQMYQFMLFRKIHLLGQGYNFLKNNGYWGF